MLLKYLKNIYISNKIKIIIKINKKHYILFKFLNFNLKILIFFI